MTPWLDWSTELVLYRMCMEQMDRLNLLLQSSYYTHYNQQNMKIEKLARIFFLTYNHRQQQQIESGNCWPSITWETSNSSDNYNCVQMQSL